MGFFSNYLNITGRSSGKFDAVYILTTEEIVMKTMSNISNAYQLHVCAFGTGLGVAKALFLILFAWIASIYGYDGVILHNLMDWLPGYRATFVGGLIGGLWGFISGFVFGAIMSFVYNYCVSCTCGSCCSCPNCTCKGSCPTCTCKNCCEKIKE